MRRPEGTDGGTVGSQLEILQLNIGEVGVRAPAIARAITGDEGQRHQATTARAFEIVESCRKQEFSFITAKQIIGCRSLSAQEGYSQEARDHYDSPQRARMFHFC